MDTKSPLDHLLTPPTPPITPLSASKDITHSPVSSHEESTSIADTPTTTSTPENSPTLSRIHHKKLTKTHNLPCFALDLLDKNGSIYPFRKDDKFFILKLQKINIEDNFPILLDKGKKILGNYFQQEIGSIPEMSFWYQRYYYYEKFDEGIQMDYESWYSVTPEPIAKYIALLTKGKSVIDGFCGSGGNVIQFSKYSSKVYAVDIEEKKLNICKNNCKVYNCQNNIEFIQGDYLTMTGKIEADYVFLSPPWGGIKYKDSDVYSIKKLMVPNIMDIVKVSLAIAKKILFYVPRNLDLDELLDVVSTIKNDIEQGSGNKLCFDIKILKSNNKVKALLIIFGLDLNEMIKEYDIKSYILRHYEGVSLEKSNLINIMIQNIGIQRFFENEYFYKKAFTIGKNINSFIKFLMNNVLNDEEKKKVRLKTNYMYYQNKTSEHKYCIYYNSHNMPTYPPVIKCTNLDVNKTYSYSHYYSYSYQHF